MIIAPYDPVSPKTDGINPDSCSNVLIEDCYIVSGDDCISLKCGWDQYGIKVGIPTKHVIIRRLTCISPDSALIALGSEMSGGVHDIRIEDTVAINTQSGIRIKTTIVFVNGSCCKDPALATGDDFYLSGLHLAWNTSNLQGSAVIPANVAQIPGLNTLSISMVRIDFRPNGLNPPHTHPRATEILVVLEVHFTLDSSPPAPVTGSSPKP
ncbi:hypothetical protein IFM89_028620 [Coptis chinensis]|uniref:Cupin type-1 domain-containing protein n=1 Tax=Coptis chinensis TaxID=261450 RepID=A0A835IFE9_9MAGN|nr:hypothetical protein IFM89_028620 [Coptis chinensis]